MTPYKWLSIHVVWLTLKVSGLLLFKKKKIIKHIWVGFESETFTAFCGDGDFKSLPFLVLVGIFSKPMCCFTHVETVQRFNSVALMAW